jgi:hypothetical protein
LIGQTFHKRDIIILIIGGLLLLLEPAILIPDSYEIALLGDCLWTNFSSGIACTEVSWNFRPPGGSILIGLLLPIFSSIFALEVLCYLSMLTVFGVVLLASKSVVKSPLYWVSICWLLASPSFRQMASLVDARILVLGFVFIAWFLATVVKDRKVAFISGILVGFAALIRPEQQLAIPLLVVFIAWRKGRMALWTLLGACLCVGGWVLALSIQSGRLILSPRHWEGWLLQMLEIVPLRWSQQFWGMGIWKPPIREAVIYQDPPSISLGVEMHSLQGYLSGIVDGIPLWLLFLAGFSLLLGLRNKSTRLLSIASILMVTPSIVANILPQARDPLFPSSNLFPLLFLLGVSPLFLLSVVLHNVSISRKWLSVGSLITLIFIAQFIRHQTIPTLPRVDDWKVSKEFDSILDRIPSQDPVIASYESASILFETGKKWQQWPSFFETREANWLIVSSIDDKVWTGVTPDFFSSSSLWNWTYSEENWVLLFKRNAMDFSEGRKDPCSAITDERITDELLKVSLAKVCLLENGNTLDQSTWHQVAAETCHPLFLGRADEMSALCISQNVQLFNLYTKRCKEDNFDCIGNGVLEMARKIVQEQIKDNIVHDSASANIAIDLACDNPKTATELSQELRGRFPNFSMYLATCGESDELYHEILQERLSYSGIEAVSGLLSILKKDAIDFRERIEILSKEESLTGVMANYVLLTVPSD